MSKLILITLALLVNQAAVAKAKPAAKAKSAAKSANFSLHERIAIGKQLERSAGFVSEKYLPKSFVNELSQKLTSEEDKAELRKLDKDWSKRYSKQVRAKVRGNGYDVQVAGTTVARIEITSLKPYKVRINEGKETEIKPTAYFSSLRGAFKTAGYSLGGQKTAWFKYLQLLPQAEAQSSGAEGAVEQTLFVMGISGADFEANGGVRTAMGVTQANYTELFGGLSEVGCSATASVGYVNIGNGQRASYTVSRTEGIILRINEAGREFVIRGTRSEEVLSTDTCANKEDSTYLDPNNRRAQNAWDQHIVACATIQRLRPDAGLACELTSPLARTESGGVGLSPSFTRDCEIMSRIARRAKHRFAVCQEADCRSGSVGPLPDDIDTFGELQAYARFETARATALAAIEDGLMKDNPGMIERDGTSFRATPSASSRVIRELNAALRRLPTPGEVPSRASQVAIEDVAVGVTGLLDGCENTEFKGTLPERPNLAPAGTTN